MTTPNTSFRTLQYTNSHWLKPLTTMISISVHLEHKYKFFQLYSETRENVICRGIWRCNFISTSIISFSWSWYYSPSCWWYSSYIVVVYLRVIFPVLPWLPSVGPGIFRRVVGVLPELSHTCPSSDCIHLPCYEGIAEINIFINNFQGLLSLVTHGSKMTVFVYGIMKGSL